MRLNESRSQPETEEKLERRKRKHKENSAVQRLKCCLYPAGSSNAARSLVLRRHLFKLSRLIIPEIPAEQPSCCFPLPSAPQVILVKPGKMQDS